MLDSFKYRAFLQICIHKGPRLNLDKERESQIRCIEWMSEGIQSSILNIGKLSTYFSQCSVYCDLGRKTFGRMLPGSVGNGDGANEGI